MIGVFQHELEELFPEYDDAVIRLWESLSASAITRDYTHEKCSVSVNFDWDPLIALLIKRRASMAKFKSDPTSADEDWWKIHFEEVRCSCLVRLSGESTLAEHDWYTAFFVESHLYDLFLVLNIALPGSANFLSVKAFGRDGTRYEDLRLSSFFFEDAWLSAKQGSWPPLQAIPVSSVAEWLRSVRPGFNQIPENAIEKALFALLHICRSVGGPEDIIWLFYAMESLFGTKPGENFSALYDRLCLVLEPPGDIGPRLKKELRRLYDYRSSFVHGGLQVIHLHHREIMDRRVEKHYGDIVELSRRWMHILIACFQRIAANQWTEISFTTVLAVK